MDNKASAMRRHNRVRTWFQAGWFALTNGYARGYMSGKIFTGNSKVLCVPGLNCYSCPGALFSCPIGSLQAVLNSGSFKVSLYVFGLMSAFGVLLGRFVCAWLCPFGLVQDLLHKIPFGPKKKNLPGHAYLRYLRFVVLAVMVIALPALVKSEGGTGQPWFCEWICPSGTLLAGIPLTIMNTSFQQIIGVRFFWKVAVLVVVCLASVMYYRPFCKYLCPLGAFYGVFNPVSVYRLEVDANKCISCGACQRACGMDIPTYQTPNSMDCIRCGDCMKACPTGAIESTLAKARKRLQETYLINDALAVAAPAAAGTAAAKHMTAMPAGTATATVSAPAVAATTVPAPTPEVAAKTANPAAGETSKATIADTVKIYARILGVLLTVGGFASIMFTATLGVFNDFDTAYTIDVLANTPITFVALNICKFMASVMVFLTGLYVLRYMEDQERLKSVDEKLRLAFLIYLLGVVIYVVHFVMHPEVLSVVLADVINFFCMLCLPILWRFGAALVRLLNGKPGMMRLNIYTVLGVIAVCGYTFWAAKNVVHFFSVIVTM